MSYRLLFFLLCCLPFSAFAQRKVAVGSLVAIGTSGVQEPLTNTDNGFAAGIRLALAYQLGLTASRSFGEGRSLALELAWQRSETRFIRRTATQVRPRPVFDEQVRQTRFAGAQLNLLFRQRLVTERKVNPLLEIGAGAFFPITVRERISESNQPARGWERVSGSRVRTAQLQSMVGFGIQWGERWTTTLRLTVPLGKAVEDEDLFCIGFCSPTPRSSSRRNMGRNTQQLQVAYLF